MKRWALVLVEAMLGGCTFQVGQIPVVGVGDACRDVVTATVARWDACAVKPEDRSNADTAMASCNQSVSATLRPISADEERACLEAIATVPCDNLDGPQPKACADLFWH